VILLSEAQQEAIDELVAAGRIEVVPVDLNRASAFLQQAVNSLADIENVTVIQNRYTLAYNAGHAAGEALLAAYGYRTTNQTGHHEALGRFLSVVLADPAQTEAVAHFKRMRRARYQMQYSARPPSETDAEQAARTATTLVGAVRKRGVA